MKLWGQSAYGEEPTGMGWDKIHKDRVEMRKTSL